MAFIRAIRSASPPGEAWGGPPVYTEKYGTESSVVRMHSGNGEHPEMDRRAIRCFEIAMDDVGIHDQALRGALLDYFTWATTKSMAAYPESKAQVSADLPIPRWSWDGPAR